ncbi:hypothetical protein ACFS27_03775 [Promicromonospora vindobonensis]|uniref:Peptidoglycan binding protein n=1 Tax=Promicromonospora vindobonensis TaxID=195748 RepID=A0ABW5VMY0_9MICO
MRRRTKVVLASAIAVTVVGGGVAVPLFADFSRNEEAATAETGLRAETVVRGSLAAGTVISGSVSRGGAEPLNGTAEGILTSLPTPGAVIEPGDRIFESNGLPTFLLQGSVPLWRPLQLGSRGKDVQSLNTSLSAAGLLDGALADDVFGPGTSAAVAALYRAAGYVPPSGTEEGVERIEAASEAVDVARDALTEAEDALVRAGAPDATGQADGDDASAAPDRGGLEKALSEAATTLDEAEQDLAIAQAEHISPSDVVILDVPRLRVEAVPVRVGDPAGGEILRWTGTGVHVEATITRSQQASLSGGDAVRITLPNGDGVEGVIASTDSGGRPDKEAGAAGGADGGAAEGGAAEGGAAEGGVPGSDTVVVRIDAESQSAISELVGAAVRVEVTTASVVDVLVVPVTALVALAEGGYAVEKVVPGAPAGSGTLVPVEVGLVAEARVEVKSSQLREGDEVLVP